MKFIATTSDKILTIAKASGQLIFSRDNRTIYLDVDANTRVEYRSIIPISTEEYRQSIVSPVDGFYFVEETAVLWNYVSSEGWRQLTQIPDEKLQFYNSTSEFPNIGAIRTLYVIPGYIYQWDNITSSYVKLGSEMWEPIV